MNEFMIQVERAVRPVRATAGRKDRMREEFLAHLTAIYEAELARLGDPALARQQALARFGDPADLTRELQASLSRTERWEASGASWFAWRAPETAAQYTFRFARRFFLVNATLSAVVTVLVWAGDRHAPDWPTRIRLGAAFLVMAHVDLFLLSLLYFKMRDRLCGGLGVSRSWLGAAGLGALAALVVVGSCLGFGLLAQGKLSIGVELLRQLFPIAVLAPLAFVLRGLISGPAEIRHTEWECLDIG
jgi:hypothetical protein